MRADIFALWGLVICVLIIIAEMKPSFKVVGVLAALLLIPLGVLVMTSGIEVQTGQTTTLTQTQNTTISGSTTIGTGADLQVFARPYPSLENTLSILLWGLGIFGAYHYITLMYPSRAMTGVRS